MLKSESLSTLDDDSVKWVMAILQSSSEWNLEFLKQIEKAFGKIDYRGVLLPFQTTNYYESEMGENLYRGFLSFKELGLAWELVAKKKMTTRIEEEWSQQGKRQYNLDVGYMDTDKLVLASWKRGPCKLSLGNGVWADMLMLFKSGQFHAQPWAFPDFKDGRYEPDWMVIREKLKAGMRKMKNRKP